MNENIDLALESDINLCFRDVIATEKSKTEACKSMNAPLMLEIVPSTAAMGHVNLALMPSNVDFSAIQGLQQLCVKDENGLTVLSSELLVNELYNIMTLCSAMCNVERCHVLQNEEDVSGKDMTFNKCLQYVGQAGPAVHTVSCIPQSTSNKHVFLTEDVSLSVPCKTWPNCASKWSLRKKTSGWPTMELTKKVISDGCHLVPKYDPLGERRTTADASERAPMTSWRYSFSLAEKTLMISITDDQKMCYLVFKYLFARFIKIPSILTTYTAKTLFLWELESVPIDQWHFSKIGERVKNLFEKLKHCIQNEFCEHFFIEGCNILQQLDDKTRKETLDVNFPTLYEELNDEPIPESGILELEPDFPFDLMTTYKSFFPELVYLRSLNDQANEKLDPPKNIPSPNNISDLLDNTKCLPIEMTEVLIYLALAQNVYGQPLPVPESLLQQQKVLEIIKFLKRSTSDERFEELVEDLDTELKFLHLQYKIFDETERFLTENPTFSYVFVHDDK